MEKTIKFYSGSMLVEDIEKSNYVVVTHRGTKEELEKIFPELFPKEEVWIESDEVLQRHDRVKLKTDDGFQYMVVSVKEDNLIIKRLTPNPSLWLEVTVKRSEVIAFPPYKHS